MLYIWRCGCYFGNLQQSLPIYWWLLFSLGATREVPTGEVECSPCSVARQGRHWWRRLIRMALVTQCPLQRHTNETLLLLMMEETRDFVIKTIPSQVLFVLVWVFGLLGNSCVLYFYGRKKRPTSASRSISFLALSDLWGCVAVLPMFYYGLHRKYTYEHEWLCKLFEWLRYSCLCSSCLLLLTIAVERRYAICTPLQFMRHAGRARLLGPICFSLGFVFMVPSWWMSGLHWEQTASGYHGCTCNVAERYYGTAFPDGYRGALLALQLTLLIIMVVSYSLVYRSVNNRAIELRRALRILPCPTQVSVHQDPQDLPVERQTAASLYPESRDNPLSDANHSDVPTGNEHEESPSTSSITNNIYTKRKLNTNLTIEHFPKSLTAQNIWATYRQEASSNATRRTSTNSQTERHFMETIEEESSYTSVFESTGGQECHYVTNVTHYKRVNFEMFHATNLSDRDKGKKERNATTSSEPMEVPWSPADPPGMLDNEPTSGAHMPSSSGPRSRQLSSSSWDVPREDGPVTGEMLARNQRLRYRTAKALLVVTVLYLLSWLPYWIFVIKKLVEPVWIVAHETWLLNIYLVTRHLYFVTFAANPIVYASVNSDFRKQLARRVGPRRSTRQQH